METNISTPALSSSIHEPAIVYHYTSLDVLVKIIQTKQIWATGIGYLNDTSESILFRDRAGERIERLLAEKPLIRTIKDDGPKPARPEYAIDATLSTYVSSFSTEDDSLPQWRAYTPPGLGVRIGFKVESLKAARIDYTDFEVRHPRAIRIPPKLSFGRIRYLNSKTPSFNDDELLMAYGEAVSEFIQPRNGSYVGRFDIFLEQRLAALGCMYKDDLFQHESEYRLIAESLYWPYVPVHFRSAKSALVPYIKIELPDSRGAFSAPRWDAIESIKIGPTPNAKLTMAAIAALIISQDISTGFITASASTYRDL